MAESVSSSLERNKYKFLCGVLLRALRKLHFTCIIYAKNSVVQAFIKINSIKIMVVCKYIKFFLKNFPSQQEIFLSLEGVFKESFKTQFWFLCNVKNFWKYSFYFGSFIRHRTYCQSQIGSINNWSQNHLFNI